MHANYHRILTMIILAAGLMIFRSFGDVPVMANATGKLGMAPASQSAPSPTIGHSSSDVAPAQTPPAAVSMDSSPSWTRLPSILLLVILLVSGMCVMFRKMETER